MNYTHRRHEIAVASVEIDPQEWDLNITVTWSEEETNRAKTFAIAQRFRSYDDAVAHGLVWAKDWIDMGKPELTPSE